MLVEEADREEGRRRPVAWAVEEAGSAKGPVDDAWRKVVGDALAELLSRGDDFNMVFDTL